MPARFTSFAIIAGMRTGSNLLEEVLSGHPDLSCHGELFNPHFVGKPDQDEALGISRAQRDADPKRMLDAVQAVPGRLAGFRIFDGHDPRALNLVLEDPSCAKIVLTRNPLDSFVSLQIARKTRQWWLGDFASSRRDQVEFDPQAFGVFLNDMAEFRDSIRRKLMASGQAAFQLRYEDLSDADVVSGLLGYLGCDPSARRRSPASRVQNPGVLEDKVTNPEALRAWIAGADPFALEEIPEFEPARGANVPGHHVAADLGLMFMPLGGIAEADVAGWLASHDDSGAAMAGKTQKELRLWMRETPGHRAFTVVDHPLRRAHDTFLRLIAGCERAVGEDVRDALTRHYGVALPENPDDPGAYRAALIGFLRFVAGNLGGQTGLRPEAAWASQVTLLSGLCRFRVPDCVLRRDALPTALPALAGTTGGDGLPEPDDSLLAQVYDRELERAAHQAYRRDYVFLGFGAWR